MSNVVDTLIEMGFSKERAQVIFDVFFKNYNLEFYSELAVNRTGSNDVQTAMDWLLSHEEEIGPSDSTVATEEQQDTNVSVSTEENTSEAVPEAAAIAKSIQCDDCGKLFKTNEEVEFHASKSG